MKFTKANVATEIEKRISCLYAHRGFDPNNGTAQVQKRSAEANRDYGQLMALESLMDTFDLHHHVNKKQL